MSAASNSKPAAVILAMLALVGVAAAAGFVLLAGSPEPAPASAQVVRAAAPPMVAEPQVEAWVFEPGTPTPTSIDEAERSAEAERPPASRMARDLERERIWAALNRKHELTPAAPGSAAPSKLEAARLPELDPEYIREAIREQLVPVALDCYTSALQDDPKLAGTLIMNFTIVGAQDVGGVVEDASIGEDSTLDSLFVSECLRESLMAVEFEPPPDGGRLEISYPVTFEPE
jgi:hypothetical protein